MRTLKFRAWDKTSNQMILFDESWLCEEYSSICWGSSGFPGIGNLPNSYGPLGEDIKNYILMQYTGLKDRCLNDVYEKDILTHDENSNNINDRGLVIYIDGRNVVEMFGPNKMTYELYDTIYNSGMTVIGNIYEHPGLLKED